MTVAQHTHKMALRSQYVESSVENAVDQYTTTETQRTACQAAQLPRRLRLCLCIYSLVVERNVKIYITPGSLTEGYSLQALLNHAQNYPTSGASQPANDQRHVNTCTPNAVLTPRHVRLHHLHHAHDSPTRRGRPTRHTRATSRVLGSRACSPTFGVLL